MAEKKKKRQPYLDKSTGRVVYPDKRPLTKTRIQAGIDSIRAKYPKSKIKQFKPSFSGELQGECKGALANKEKEKNAIEGFMDKKKKGTSIKTFKNPTLKSLRNWMGY